MLLGTIPFLTGDGERMMTKEKIEELRHRLLNHEVENEIAIVKVTAHELQELIELAEKQLDSK